MKVLAIDIGGTKIATAIIDENLNITNRQQMVSASNNTPETFTKEIHELIAQFDPNDYDGVAIGTAGTVHNGMLTCLTPTSIGPLNNFPFTKTFQEAAHGKPVLALNDAQAATWAEYTHAKKPNMGFVTVSTGVGGGFIINDDIHIGATSLAGHIGHMLVRMPSPVKQIYGEYALVEDIASGTAIAKATLGWEKPCTTAEVFALQKQGDARADQVVKNAVVTIATMIASLVVANDIHDFYLGGSVAIHTDFIQQVQAEINKMPPQYHAQLFPAHFSQDAVLIGAADYYFKRFINK